MRLPFKLGVLKCRQHGLVADRMAVAHLTTSVERGTTAAGNAVKKRAGVDIEEHRGADLQDHLSSPHQHTCGQFNFSRC